MKGRTDKVMGLASRPNLIDLAERSGIFNLSSSDLVFNSSQMGISYYDFVMSFSRQVNGFEIYLIKFDTRTNVEAFQTLHVPITQLNQHQLPSDELSIITLGILTWRQELAQSKLLVLVNHLNGPENAKSLDALKKACAKFKCTHHVVSLPQRINSPGSPLVGKASKGHESMKMRVLLCQSQLDLQLGSRAIAEAKYLLTSQGNPLLCFCFPLN